jgi:thioredoxin reductase (NADPH)
MENFEKIFDYIIVGGGFAGLFLKKLLEKKSIDHLLIENQLLGGQLNLYANKYIYDIPGILKISGQQLMDQLMPTSNYLENCHCQSMEITEDYKIIHCLYQQKNIPLKAKFIIFTAGKGSVKAIKFPYPGLEPLEMLGKIHYSLGAHHNYKNKSIAVLGGGDSAMDAVELMASQGALTHLIHRRNLTAMAGKIASVEKCSTNTMVLNSTIEKFVYDEDTNSIHIYITQRPEPIIVHEIFMFYGVLTDHSTLNGLVQGNKLTVDYDTLQAQHPIIDFALGDVATYPNKRFLIHNYMAEALRLVDFIDKNHS